MKEILKNLFLFKNCDIDAICKECDLLSKIKEKRYHSGDVILSPAGGQSGIFVVISGKAKITPSENKTTILRTVSEGDTFGAASLFASDRDYKTNVIAYERCSVLILEKDICEQIVRKYPECAVNLISFLNDRIAFLNRKITAFTAGSADEKTAAWILSLPIAPDGTRKVQSYSAASSSIALGRASLYRALENLEISGYIKRESKSITVLNEKALMSLI